MNFSFSLPPPPQPPGTRERMEILPVYVLYSGVNQNIHDIVSSLADTYVRDGKYKVIQGGEIICITGIILRKSMIRGRNKKKRNGFE